LEEFETRNIIWSVLLSLASSDWIGKKSNSGKTVNENEGARKKKKKKKETQKKRIHTISIC